MKRHGIAASVCLILAIAAGAWTVKQAPPAPDRGLAERLLGPIAEVAAAVEWVRADAAWASGRIDLYDARAELALKLTPGDPHGWAYYAHHLVFDRGSPRRGALESRRAWVEAGLAVLDRGEAVCREPGNLAFQRGIIFLSLAQVDDADRPLAISRKQAWTQAADAFERAARSGVPVAAEAARAARVEAEAEK